MASMNTSNTVDARLLLLALSPVTLESLIHGRELLRTQITNCSVVTVYKAMYDNTPPDKLVVAITMPQVIGSGYLVTTLLDCQVRSQCLAKSIDSLQRLACLLLLNSYSFTLE